MIFSTNGVTWTEWLMAIGAILLILFLISLPAALIGWVATMFGFGFWKYFFVSLIVFFAIKLWF